METWVVIVLVVVGLAVLWLILKLCMMALVGAVVLLEYANEAGFVGFAAYVALWVFLFPVMLVISVVVGFSQLQDDREAQQALDGRKQQRPSDTREQQRASDAREALGRGV